MFKDKIIKCQDCGQDFPWTVDEQEFYKSKGLPEPKYCMICRGKYEARKVDYKRYGKKV